MKNIILIFVIYFIWKPLFANNADTVVVLDIKTKNVTTILPVAYDSIATNDYTAYSLGTMPNTAILAMTPPTTNLFHNSQFSKPAAAQGFYNVADFPLRTACRIRCFYNGQQTGIFSGTLVGSEMVVMGAFYLCQRNTFDWIAFDSLIVNPAFDNGSPQANFPESTVKKVCIFKAIYHQDGYQNVALLQLEKPLGETIGYVGLGFNTDTSFYSNKIFHKFSYAGKSPFDTLTRYNTDTLLYNYGYIQSNSSNSGLSVYSSEAIYRSGQWGSTMIYTNNINEYYCLGFLTWYNLYHHYNLNAKEFYNLKNIMDHPIILNNNELKNENFKLTVYPNPANNDIIIQTKSNNIKLYDVIGNEQAFYSTISANKQQTKINIQHLRSGIFFIRVDEKVMKFVKE